MGLQCSILGHAFEAAGVEREREEQGSEVVTTEREIERCRRCGTERVVSESTEVAAIVDAADVGLEPTDDSEDRDEDRDIEETAEPNRTAGGGIAGAVERSGVDDSDAESEGAFAPDPDESETEPSGGVDPSVEPAKGEDRVEISEERDAPDPETEDAEILTDDDEPGRQPGQWPEDVDTDTAAEPQPTDFEEESLSGITVPRGEIVCPECGFSVEANSGYRDGDPCPDCTAWLEAERNQ